MKTYELLLRYGIAETARQTGINENTLKGFVDKLLKDEFSIEAEKAKLMDDFKKKLVEQIKDSFKYLHYTRYDDIPMLDAVKEIIELIEKEEI